MGKIVQSVATLAILAVATALTVGIANESEATPVDVASSEQVEADGEGEAGATASSPAGLAVTAVSVEPQDAIIGLWRLDPESIKMSDERFAQVPAEYRAEAVAQARRSAGAARFEFTREGAMNLYAGDMMKEGAYEITSVNSDTLFLGTVPDLSQLEITQNLSVRVGVDRLWVTDLATTAAPHVLVRVEIASKAQGTTPEPEPKATAQ